MATTMASGQFIVMPEVVMEDGAYTRYFSM